MSQDPNQGRVAPLSAPDTKTLLERAKQIQEMQRALEAQPAAKVATQAATAPQTSDKPTSSGSNHLAVFDVKPVEQVNMLTGPSATGADQAVYGAKQADVASLYGMKSGDTETVPTGPIWKVIKFSSGEVLDLPKAGVDYDIKVPPNAVKLKQGNLVQLTATPKAAGSTEPVRKKAVLVDDTGNLKGADWGSRDALEKGLKNIPSFAFVVPLGVRRRDEERPQRAACEGSEEGHQERVRSDAAAEE